MPFPTHLSAELPQSLTNRLQLALPGAAAQRTMEPELSFGRHTGPPRPDARPAAVVALLHPLAGEWHVALMLRHESMAHHAGQISLPGGTIEPNETSEEAALRELEEELGASRFSALLLGALSPVYLFGTNFLISPWVAAIRSPVEFSPNAGEVQEILQIPLAHLMRPELRGVHIERRGSIELHAPHFKWNNHRIWGATAIILAELVAAIGEISSSAVDAKLAT